MRLFDHQKEAINNLQSGNILQGGTGSGKSITAIAWYFCVLCGGKIDPLYFPMTNPKPLYIITTAKKRDSLEWEKDLLPFNLNPRDEYPLVIIDSWNNIKKYVDIKDAVFLFDEQRVIGNGTWVKCFLKIAKQNQWILLTATPGDKMEDYIPVFLANGFYRNITDFRTQHIEYDPYSKFHKVLKYHNSAKFIRLREQITVRMHYDKGTEQIHKTIKCNYNKELTLNTIKNRWDIFKNEPIESASSLCYILRRIANSDPSRIIELWEIHQHFNRIIVFYNFNYELDALRQMCDEYGYNYAEWNGQKHEEIPDTDEWLYFVQYSAGNEGWNCITCKCIVFYSASYSYKTMIQASGRIDRLNTPFKTLFYYHLTSDSIIDKNINSALKKKKKFNEKDLERLLK